MHRIANTLFLLACLGLPSVQSAENQKSEPTNFVIFVADDMAWDDSGPYGNQNVRTPNMDRLAVEGMRFDQAYLTCSSCSPSRCSMLTGRYPHNTGAGELHLPLPKDQTMLTTPLRAMGYWTAVVGKWHLGNAAAEQVDFRKGSKPDAMGAAWVEAIENRPKDRPFFMWAAHSDPHRAYAPGAVTPPHAPERVSIPAFLPDTPDVREDLALYYDEVSRFDEHIGMVLEELESQGLTESTMILVISDNGRPFPHCKTMVTVPGVRTPFIAKLPNRIPAGTTNQQVISSIDIAPTILELAGVKPLDTMQGKSLRRTLMDPKQVIRKHAFSEHNWHDYRAFERAAFDRQYCYVRNWLPSTPATPPADAVNSPTYREMKRLFKEGKLTDEQQACMMTPRREEFLFDTIKDPNCLNNLAEDPGMISRLKQLRLALDAWQKRTGDQFPGEDQLTPDGFNRETGDRMIKGAHPSLISKKQR
ncbi:sulfatase [bacterium]|nr:sulfatase [bacterium]MDC0278797.1 sulfatase [bacterium]